ncbi:DUF1223 domain-containing protein [Tunicatimonas pelagia]|uniref:DUF1223 domain-containing protein n=1 Tax=Tunicatimonas pelagia TaxID=931531 RepID=UPI0026653F65|nr:DUF1223 domain-containing protein [Tunicatimonas pelagia]WKN44627.1 DUF1223 domain-containing protein [Tunicatimonas pelagia]
MKYSFSFTVVLLLVLGFTFLLVAWISPSRNLTPAYESPGFAVVELFTSQGCSSCPPADALLSDIAQKAEQQNLPIHVLSFHVDYWNRLGWKDPYSQPDFSARQRQYTQTWQNTQMYTPQMTINGNSGFVGSRQQQAWRDINSTLKQPAHASVVLQATTTKEQATVAYQVLGDYQGKDLQIALVEKHIQTSVRRGENGGKMLHHTHVVREFSRQSLSSSAQGKARLRLPPDLQPANALIIAYVQDRANLKISGATSVALTNI